MAKKAVSKPKAKKEVASKVKAEPKKEVKSVKEIKKKGEEFELIHQQYVEVAGPRERYGVAKGALAAMIQSGKLQYQVSNVKGKVLVKVVLKK